MLPSSEKKKFEDIRNILDDKNYDIVKTIGKGAFGQVLLARNRSNDKPYAVKIINRALVRKKPFLQKYIDQEIDIMKKLDHPNIVRYEYQFSTPEFIVIIMEYCEQGNLLSLQSRLPGKTFPLRHAIKVIVQVMKGLKCIHEKNFIHRDIKSQNVLLKKVGNETSYKIADFGFARTIGGVGAKTHCGTEKYMAPQIIANSYYGISVDIWALGILFYFMLFAEYPFKSHDMKSEIQKRCTPFFSLSATVSKKEKIKDSTPQLEDFFKRIFVIDSKKRFTFSNIIKHPLLSEYEKEFEENMIFYNQLEKKEELYKDPEANIEYGFDTDMEPEDDTRYQKMKKKQVSQASRHIQYELEELFFEIDKMDYLKDCAHELFDSYSSFLSYSERLAAKYYLLKAYLFYSDPFISLLSKDEMPRTLQEVNVTPTKWGECVKTPEYARAVGKLVENNMKARIDFEDTYSEVNLVANQVPIKNFMKGFKLNINERTFEELKFSYRSTTSYIFKAIHENKKIDSHTRNKIKMRLFCCHMINRIFNRTELGENFPFFTKWLKANKIEYPNCFDFFYFKMWIYNETQLNLEANISLLHRTFF